MYLGALSVPSSLAPRGGTSSRGVAASEGLGPREMGESPQPPCGLLANGCVEAACCGTVGSAVLNNSTARVCTFFFFCFIFLIITQFMSAALL